MKNKLQVNKQDQHLIETVIDSKIVYPGQYLKIWRDEVELSNGHKSYREYIKHPGAAMAIPLLDNNTVLMVKQYRHAVGQVFLEFPAGKKDENENSEQTAARELQEEIGYQSNKLTYLTRIHPVIGYANEHIDLFLAEQLSKTKDNRDHDEILDVIKVSIDELEQAVWQGQVSDVKTQIGFFWLKKHFQSKT
jgi:ADP-ribose pyrophosphatase